MINFKKFLFLFIITLFIAAMLHPSNIQAEIATTRDWIGLFVVGSGDDKSNTVGGNHYLYANSCGLTPGTSPKIENQNPLTACSFTPPATKGAYELRLYGNDSTTSEGLIGQSKVMWVPFDFSPLPPTCSIANNTLTADLKWQWPTPLAGISRLTLNRSGNNSRIYNFEPYTNQNGYTDIIPSASGIYSYYLTASNNRDSRNSDSIINVGVTPGPPANCNVVVVTPTPTPTPTSGVTPTPTTAPDVILVCPQRSAGDNPRPIEISQGLLSIKDNNNLNNKFSTTDKCIIGEKAGLPQFSIPAYNELKSIYFNQNKSSTINKYILTGDQVDNTSTPIIKIGPNDGNQPNQLYNITGNLSLGTDPTRNLYSSPVLATKTGVVFVDGNFFITGNSLRLLQNMDGSYENPNHNSIGLVFVVQGDVYVDASSTWLDAFIITYGTLCTTWNGNTTTPHCYGYGEDPMSVFRHQLAVNGSFISLDPNKPPQFGRYNGNNDATRPGEDITYDPKYLIILKDIFAKDLAVWNEVQ